MFRARAFGFPDTPPWSTILPLRRMFFFDLDFSEIVHEARIAQIFP